MKTTTYLAPYCAMADSDPRFAAYHHRCPGNVEQRTPSGDVVQIYRCGHDCHDSPSPTEAAGGSSQVTPPSDRNLNRPPLGGGGAADRISAADSAGRTESRRDGPDLQRTAGTPRVRHL